MVLSKKDILARIKTEELLIDYTEDNVQTCSYDLRLGGQYYYQKNNSDSISISTLKKGDVLKIPPHAICYVITEESVKIPNNLTASISLSFGLINKGVMLAAQPPYDPGYSGKTVALLHNLSDEPIRIKRGDHILNIVFSTLSGQVDKNDLYNGNYQKLTDLSMYCKEKRVGAVFKLNQEFKQTTERFNRAVPNLLTILTVLIGIVTIGITVIFSLNSRNDNTPKFYVNEEQGVLTIDINQKLYELSLRNAKDDSADNKKNSSASNTDFYVDEEQSTLIISIDGKQYEVGLNSTDNAVDDQ